MNQNSAFLSTSVINYIKNKYKVDPNLDQILQIFVISLIGNVQTVIESLNANTLSNISGYGKLILIPLFV